MALLRSWADRHECGFQLKVVLSPNAADRPPKSENREPDPTPPSQCATCAIKVCPARSNCAIVAHLAHSGPAVSSSNLNIPLIFRSFPFLARLALFLQYIGQVV